MVSAVHFVWQTGALDTHISWNLISDRSSALPASERSIKESMLNGSEAMPAACAWETQKKEVECGDKLCLLFTSSISGWVYDS